MRCPFSVSEIWYFSKDQILYNGRISLGTTFSCHCISGIAKNGDDKALYYPALYVMKKSSISSSNLDYKIS